MKIMALGIAMLFACAISELRAQSYALAEQQSVATFAANSQNYQTLMSALRATNLEKVLNYDGPFTVFAPSDQAFKRLSSVDLGKLMEPGNLARLQDLLAYHIVAGNFTASRILKAMCRGNGKATFTTVQGEKIVATMEGIDILITDAQGNSARITTADESRCNGTVHEIDSVILPSKI